MANKQNSSFKILAMNTKEIKFKIAYRYLVKIPL